MQTPLLYPLRGLLFVATHQLLFRRVLGQGTKYAAVSLTLLAALYTLTYNFQYALLSAVIGKGTITSITTVMAIVAEASLPLMTFMSRMSGGAQDELFDEVLAAQGVTKVSPLPAAELEEIRLAAETYHQQTYKPAQNKSTLQTVLGYVNSLLNLTGWVQSWIRGLLSSTLLVFGPLGWLAFLYTNGTAAGAECHRHYFRRKGVLKQEEMDVVVRSRASQYARFGATVVLINLIPLASWSFASTVGAAIWAADLERSHEKLMQGELKDTLGDIKSWAGGHVDTDKVAELIESKGVSTIRKFNNLRETLFASNGDKKAE